MKHFLLAAPLLALLGCASTCERPAGTVQHVVVVWLKEPGDAAARAKLIETAQGLESIPGIVSLRVGEPLASDREVVDDSFDVALVIDFTDAAALAAYDTHPDHVRAVEEVLAPLSERIVVYDFAD